MDWHSEVGISLRLLSSMLWIWCSCLTSCTQIACRKVLVSETGAGAGAAEKVPSKAPTKGTRRGKKKTVVQAGLFQNQEAALTRCHWQVFISLHIAVMKVRGMRLRVIVCPDLYTLEEQFNKTIWQIQEKKKKEKGIRRSENLGIRDFQDMRIWMW